MQLLIKHDLYRNVFPTHEQANPKEITLNSECSRCLKTMKLDIGTSCSRSYAVTIGVKTDCKQER